VYLFFNNDLTDQDLDLRNMTSFDGFLVRQRKEDGAPFTEAEYRTEIERILHPPRSAVLPSIMNLTHLRAVLHRFAGLAAPLEQHLVCVNRFYTYRPENVEGAVNYTLAMQRMSTERGMRFHVLIVPYVGEAAQHRYAPSVAAYIERLRAHRVHVIEMLDRLSPNDYFREEGHFNPSGARRAAEAIIQGLSESP
jgi:hypothetical protein